MSSASGVPLFLTFLPDPAADLNDLDLTTAATTTMLEYLEITGIKAYVRGVCSSGLSYIILGDDHEALVVQEKLRHESVAGLRVRIISREEWCKELRKLYEDEAYGDARILDKEIARVQGKIQEAGDPVPVSLQHALYQAQKSRAQVKLYNLHQKHRDALVETLEAPLWPRVASSIKAVIHQLDEYDHILCDPNRDFRMFYYEHGVVAAIKGECGGMEEIEKELVNALGIELEQLSLWEEMVIHLTS
ncbi:hypothetical protein BGX38DRAFT_1144124 [Terfezia claveryi]|nr:hypothetical protein BGX38DRAFT_1144124 [Terfezia claveryi]